MPITVLSILIPRALSRPCLFRVINPDKGACARSGCGSSDVVCFLREWKSKTVVRWFQSVWERSAGKTYEEVTGGPLAYIEENRVRCDCSGPRLIVFRSLVHGGREIDVMRESGYEGGPPKPLSSLLAKLRLSETGDHN
ncbi:hypothetical protein BaRGS_00027238 [Batillaria attramentaria]|uniref:Uncharacterized protein n=1 Tax=Batillaria attramentaria TaxID=370345 RepID=A0ABD0K2F6_9CAEN